MTYTKRENPLPKGYRFADEYETEFWTTHGEGIFADELWVHVGTEAEGTDQETKAFDLALPVVPEHASCDECGREDRPLTKVDQGIAFVYLCDRHLGRNR